MVDRKLSIEIKASTCEQRFFSIIATSFSTIFFLTKRVPKLSYKKVMQKLINNVIQESKSVAKNIVLVAQAHLEVVDRELDRAPFTLPHVSQTYSDAIEKHHNLQDWRSVY
jgi:uncharacterized membrane protein